MSAIEPNADELQYLLSKLARLHGHDAAVDVADAIADAWAWAAQFGEAQAVWAAWMITHGARYIRPRDAIMANQLNRAAEIIGDAFNLELIAQLTTVPADPGDITQRDNEPH